MYHSLFENLSKHIRLSSEEFELISSKVQRTLIRKNNLLLQEKEYSNTIYFVEKGCLGIFSSTKSGKETNVLFAPENWWACDIYSFTNNKPSRFSIEALEDTVLFGFHYRDMEELYHVVPKLDHFFRILFQNASALYQYPLIISSF